MDKSAQKQKSKKAVAEFVPSTGDESYLQSLPSDITLDELTTLVNSAYSAGITLAKKATQEMIKCGNYLQEARKMHKGDKEFGQWRKKNIDFSQSHCARLMAVAREFGKNKDAHLLPISTLSELLPAPPEVKEKVIAKAVAGEKITRKDVKELKDEAKDISSPQESEAEPVLAGKPVRTDKKSGEVRTIDPVAEAQAILDLPFLERLSQLEVRTDDDAQFKSFLIFGIPPYGDGIASQDTIEGLYVYYVQRHVDIEEDLTGDSEHKLETAYNILMAMYD